MASDMPTILQAPASPVSGYSAAVRIELKIDGRVLFPTHTAFDFLIFHETQVIAPAMGRLVICVDGVPHETAVEILPHESPATQIPIRIPAHV